MITIRYCNAVLLKKENQWSILRIFNIQSNCSALWIWFDHLFWLYSKSKSILPTFRYFFTKNSLANVNRAIMINSTMRIIPTNAIIKSIFTLFLITNYISPADNLKAAKPIPTNAAIIKMTKMTSNKYFSENEMST